MLRSLTFAILILFLGSAGCSKEKDPVQEKPGRILVLMYHRIVKEEPGNLYERSIANLENDLKYIKNNNIKILSFNDLQNLSLSDSMPAGNGAILTFDDGDESGYTLVKPLLLSYKMEATFFLWTYMMGHESFLTWQEIGDMANYMLENGKHPFVFGSHTYSHAYLFDSKGSYGTATEYNAFLDYELGVSKQMIEEYTPGDVTILSLPYGDGYGDQEIISAAQRNGYKFIRTSKWGAIADPATSLFKIPSLPMLDTTKSETIGLYLGLKNQK